MFSQKILKQRWFPPALIFGVVFLLYSLTIFNGFVYDDIDQVLNNIWITDTKYISRIFLSGTWDFKEGHGAGNYYRPVMHMLFMGEMYIFGPARPGLWHLFNVGLHAINAVIVYRLYLALLNEFSLARKDQSSLESSALLAAIIYATHPMASEVVLWVSALPELSLAFFYLLSFLFYIRFARSGARLPYIFSLLLFFLATLSKETALTLPLLIITFDLIKRSRPIGRVIRGYIPFALLGLIYLIIRANALHRLVPLDIAHPYLGPYEKTINIFPLIAGYIRSLLIPVNLNIFHIFKPVFSLSEPKALISILVTAVIPVGFYIFRSKKLILLLFSLILLPLLSVMYIPVLGGNPFSERYLYLSITGYALLLVLLHRYCRERWGVKPSVVLFMTIVIFYSAIIVVRLPQWRTTESLWQATLRTAPDNTFALNELGRIYATSARDEQAIRYYTKALAIYKKRSYPNLDVMEDFVSAIADLHTRHAQRSKAIELYETLYRAYPVSFNFTYRLAILYQDAGRGKRAMKLYQALLTSSANTNEKKSLHVNIANILAQEGQYTLALEEYDKALRLVPNDALTLRNISIVREKARKTLPE